MAAVTQASPPTRKMVSIGQLPLTSRIAMAQVGFVLFLLLIWQLLAQTGALGATPTPVAVAGALLKIFIDGSVWAPLGLTLASWSISFVLVSTLGVLLGIPLGASRIAYRIVSFVLDFCRTVPTLALVPLVVLLFGTSLQSTVLLASLGAVWVVLLQTIYGVRDIDPVARDSFRSFRVRPIDVATRLVLPSAAPYIATGLRIAAAVCLLITLSVQIIIAAPGIGQQITVTQLGGAIPEMYAYIVLSGLLGVGLNALILVFERRLLSWHPSYRKVLP